MFNLQGSELVIILLLALVVLGPEKLPDAMRKAGQFYAELKKMSSGFQKEFRDVIDEPMREVRDTANLLRDSADFRKLQDGERTEKPKSAEMLAAADPDAEPTTDVPTFEADTPAGPTEIDDTSTEPGEPTESEQSPEPTEPIEPTEPGDPDQAAEPLAEPAAVEHGRPAAPPAPPPPFSSSHVSSASPPVRADASALQSDNEHTDEHIDDADDLSDMSQSSAEGSAG